MNIKKDPSGKLILAIVQTQDASDAVREFNNQKISTYQLPSIGGFLGLQNSTLLIYSPVVSWKSIIKILQETCKMRIEFIPINADGMTTPSRSLLTEIMVGGATVFAFDVEKYEEF